MIKKIRALLLVFLLLIFQGSPGTAQDIPVRPDPPRLVNDFAEVLAPGETRHLEQKLLSFNDSTSTQIVIVTVKSLNGYDKADFSYRLGELWGVGQKGKNNGIVVLVKPKLGNEPGQAFISTGYGLEAVIPDAIAKRIVEQEMIPFFREGNYYGGLDKATTTLMGLARGEFTADDYVKDPNKNPLTYLVPFLVIAAIFFLIRMSRARSYSIGKSIPFWTAFWLLGSLGGRSYNGSWGNFSSGSGPFGGGGSFGGFGGGSFGGGGAGGSW